MRGLLVQVISKLYENSLFLKRIWSPHDAVPPLKAGLADARAMPNFFIVGAARCGTTSLFDALGQHPDVFCCPVKEPNFFATELAERPHVVESARRRGVLLAPGMASLAVLPRVAITLDYDTYLSLFGGWAGQRAVGEASTAYLMSPRAAAEIARRRPDGRIIVVLRHPVERARSEAQMHAQLGREEGGGPDVIAASLYAPQVRRFLEAFPREQILFLRFENMLAEPAATLKRVFRHIGVDPEAAAGITLRHENKSRQVRFEGFNRMLFRSGLRDVLAHILPASLRRAIARRYYKTAPASPDAGTADPAISLALFRADIEETGRLIGEDLSAWLVRRTASAEHPSASGA